MAQRYAVVLYDERDGTVFTVTFEAADGEAAVAEMNRRHELGRNPRPLTLIKLPPKAERK